MHGNFSNKGTETEVMDISNITDHELYEDYEKKIRLLGLLKLDYSIYIVKDGGMQKIVEALKEEHSDFGIIVEQLRIWCSQHRMQLHTIKDHLQISDSRV